MAFGMAQSAVSLRRTKSEGALSDLAPGRHHYALLPPPDSGLISDFVTHLGGDPAAYDGRVPAHFFPQWTFPILIETLKTATLKGLPIAAHKLLNGGFRMEIKGPLPQGEALEVEAWLEAIDDGPRKTRLTQRIVTGTASSPEALTVDFFPVVPKKGGRSAPRDTQEATGADDPMRDPRVRPEIPTEGLTVLGTVELSDRAGLDFALLTGDFNLIHWLKPAARASGFKNVILHGFSSAGRALEAYVRERLDGDPSRVRAMTARFNKPLVLPAKGTIWADAHGSVWLGKAQGEKSWMSGHIVAD